jgi:NAD(P)-dependent dehydrogenase (short-subunit alcohol dehydrogenase family)
LSRVPAPHDIRTLGQTLIVMWAVGWAQHWGGHIEEIRTQELVSAGHRAIAVRCDVADEAEVAAMVEQTVSTFGRLDAAFNNAGVQSPAVETADASGEEFDRVNAINLRGVWNCMKYELHQMREQGSGAIVNCSSIGDLIGIEQRIMHPSTE